jgi:hypothetical protein
MRGDFQRGPLPNDMKMKPIAVLPNVIRAAAAKQIQVTTVVDSYSLDCRTEKDPKNPALTVSSQVALNTPRRIPKGISVQVTGSPQMHCGDTNLIEVIVDGSKGWFRNRDFAFSYKQKAITLFEVSQDLECCWIE